MPDKILLLPDNIANQIAAGEVIQRPASAVKELLENAIDSGATQIRLFIHEAGKSQIQVVDNGHGMSETDARMSFERHATSKIRNIEDLFHIRTMGFRGEALASIAAVSQVELRTRRQEDETGTLIQIENSVVVRQEPVAAPSGTSISMKNLFFNIPARRNFLKSNPVELRHIIDEFIRVALAFPSLFFSMSSNGQEVFHLEAGSLKQRIVQLMGAQYNTRLVTVKEDTDYLNIRGFVGKPESAKKTRGDQYFFVNNRFIKSAYLNHALQHAYQEMIAADSFPMYVLFIDLDPSLVDVNVHPTKQEIKFEDEKIVYAFVQASVKHALAQFSVTPTLDFDLDSSIQQLESIQKPFTENRQSQMKGSAIFQSFTEANQAHKIDPASSGFKSLSEQFSAIEVETITEKKASETNNEYNKNKDTNVILIPGIKVQPDMNVCQLFLTYILVASEDRFLLIHQQSAHERIIYERLILAFKGKSISIQKTLFPVTLDLAPADAVLLNELLPDLSQMGFNIEPFGKQTFIIQGSPADISMGNEKESLEKLLELYKHQSSEVKISKREKLVRTIAYQQAVKPGIYLGKKECEQLVQDLFQSSQPNFTATGKPTYLEFKKEQLEKMFGRHS